MDEQARSSGRHSATILSVRGSSLMRASLFHFISHHTMELFLNLFLHSIYLNNSTLFAYFHLLQYFSIITVLIFTV